MSGYELWFYELLEYEAAHGIRSACHVLWYGRGEGPPVCLVGNFDDAFGSSTTNAIESVATAVATRFGRDDFRLIEWYPRDGTRRFSEVTLTPVPATEVEHGTVAIGSGNDPLTVRRTTAIVRFADPRWARRTENELARLLGEEEIRDLRSFAGLPGDYTPERRFRTTGERLAKSIRAHNDRIIEVLDAHTKEWTDHYIRLDFAQRLEGRLGVLCRPLWLALRS